MSDQMNIKGSVQLIQDLQTFDSGFTKQVLILNTGGEYPQEIPIEFVKDKTSLIANLQVGTPVEVGIDIRGNEYNGKYYANIQGWKIDLIGGQPAQDGAPAPQDSEDIPY